MPFDLLGFDTDNDSVFINETLRDYCRDSGIVFTRCRPWRKNDQAFVEQKNGSVVRRIVGYRRLEGLDAAAALSRLYDEALRQLLPALVQAGVEASGRGARQQALPRARHAQPAAARGPADASRRVRARRRTAASLDPIRLLRQMRTHQQRIVDIVDKPIEAPDEAAVPPLERFLAGLRTAWADGDARPTARAPEKPKRGRRRPDPLVKVTEQLHAWFEAEPWSTSRQLLERLQAAHPGEYPDSLLRTLQRRVKAWRREKAAAMVFGELPPPGSADDAD